MNELVMKFDVPSSLNASAPVETQGKSRDDVKLMVLKRSTGESEHTEFKQLSDFLNKGDVLVLNNSRTIPASLTGTQGNRKVTIRLSRKVTENSWDALLIGDIYKALEPIEFSGGVKAKIIGKGSEQPLVRLEFNVNGTGFYDFLYREGEPIRYEYIKTPWPLNCYQTVYGSVPGSVEMASAGRAFTWKLMHTLKEKGIKMVFLQLHTGLSYYGDDRWPTPKNHPEEYHVPKEAVQEIIQAKKNGKRVIAIGTTVVRALETVSAQYGELRPTRGVTNLYISKETPLKIVDGLVTGLHEPEASHLDLLSAFIAEEKLFHAYQGALLKNYKWHEFGDMNLIV
ncbi:S-adenosylmethionine:tRNA ribosyltransferase-isomerase [Rossellomorea aquimaris]|uniref:S-adenosylmethionine:tRNA ribosyltransferase-isomerase n=1 Tax=Rossellomorea aquimaris TaxID=189382 RepID=UPI0007D0491A|nr:S-adenosylmethionine:tRNA ribosyltransferase-isomerase [Rossellomorea aquimaris]